MQQPSHTASPVSASTICYGAPATPWPVVPKPTGTVRQRGVLHFGKRSSRTSGGTLSAILWPISASHPYLPISVFTMVMALASHVPLRAWDTLPSLSMHTVKEPWNRPALRFLPWSTRRDSTKRLNLCGGPKSGGASPMTQRRKIAKPSKRGPRIDTLPDTSTAIPEAGEPLSDRKCADRGPSEACSPGVGRAHPWRSP